MTVTAAPAGAMPGVALRRGVLVPLSLCAALVAEIGLVFIILSLG